MKLTEFLLARIREDQVNAQSAARALAVGKHADGVVNQMYVTLNGEKLLVFDLARAKAECEAKRQIIEDAWKTEVTMDLEFGWGHSRERMEADGEYPQTLKLMALPYAYHPDFDVSWLP